MPVFAIRKRFLYDRRKLFFVKGLWKIFCLFFAEKRAVPVLPKCIILKQVVYYCAKSVLFCNRRKEKGERRKSRALPANSVLSNTSLKARMDFFSICGILYPYVLSENFIRQAEIELSAKV